MCNAAVIPALLQIGGAAAGLDQQRANAKALTRFNEQRFRLNKDSARKAAIAKSSALQRQVAERAEAAAAEVREVARRGIASRGRAVAAAGSGAGGFGGSFEAVLLNLVTQEADFRSARIRSLQLGREQTQLQLLGVQAEETNRIRAGIGSPVPRPDYLGTLLSVTGSSLQTAVAFSINETNAQTGSASQ